MSRMVNSILFLCMLFLSHSLVFAAEGKYNEARGQLLYTTHCNTCHTTEIHWREHKLVTDWESLVVQVRRWQYLSGLNWNDDEIADVSHYLDGLFYGYKNTAQGKKPVQLIHKN